MNVIELERWKPSKTGPRRLEYAGQPAAQEVFEELKYRLESMGYLPDEYFLMDDYWQDGREIPRDADIFCTTDYGGSEGVYLDVYLKWYEDGKPITRSFITGKTLGESGNDLDRMFLISSAITSSAQTPYPSPRRKRQGSLIPLCLLSPQSQKSALRGPHVSQAQRVTWGKEEQGSVRSFRRQAETKQSGLCDNAGQRPLHISAYDKAVLAIRDGELSAFKELYPQTLEDHADDLLIETAGRPGTVGRKMTLLLLADVEQFPETIYRAACQKAIDINDPEKVSFLLEQADRHIPNLSPSLHGEMAIYAHTDHCFIAKQIIRQCTDEQIAAAPPHLLEQFAMDEDYHTMSALVEKGISGGPDAWRTLHMLTYENRNSWIAKHLLQKRMWVDIDDYNALHACVKNDAVEVCKLLLDGGMDFDVYQQWAKNHQCCGHEETLQTLADYWAEMQAEMEQSPAPETGGMTLG